MRQLKMYSDARVVGAKVRLYSPPPRGATSPSRASFAHPPSRLGGGLNLPPPQPSPAPSSSGETFWNSNRNTEVKRLLRPGVADGPAQLAANLSRAGAVAINLQPLAGEEMAVLAEGLRRAVNVTAIRLACEARGGGVPVPTVAGSGPRARKLATLGAAKLNGVDALLASPRVGESLGLALAAHVRASDTVAEVEINADLGAAAFEHVGRALASSSSVRKVSFRGSKMGDRAFAGLVVGLRECASVAEVNLAECALTDASGPAVASILRAQASRFATDEWANNLRVYDARGKASSREKERSSPPEARRSGVTGVARVDLSENAALSDASAKSLCDALRQDATLEFLGVRGCDLDEKAAARFARAMRDHPRLDVVDLRGAKPRDAAADPEPRAAPLGILRVAAETLASSSETNAEARDAEGECASEVAVEGRKKEVFMDMRDAAPRPAAPKDVDVARGSAKHARPSSARPSSARSASTASRIEGRRGWSPASGAVPPKWGEIGTHTAAGKAAVGFLPPSPFRGGAPAAASARPRRARPASAGPWTAPKLARSKADAVLATRSENAGARRDGGEAPAKKDRGAAASAAAKAKAAKVSEEKAIVRQLTRALRALEGEVAGAAPEELRRRVAAAERASAEAEDRDGAPSAPSERALAKVRRDLEALRRMCH